MEWTPITIGLLLSVLIIGYLIGLLEASLKRSKKEKPPAGLPKSEPISSSGGEIEVLRAWRSSAGKVRLEMDGQRIDDKERLQTEQRRRLVNILLDLRPWLEFNLDSPPARMSQEQPVVPPVSAKTTQPSKGQPFTAPFSIVAQIDQILQNRLAGTPLAARGVRLQESPQGGAIVWVGVERFEGIDAVPDPEVKAAIRQAVAEWEQKPHQRYGIVGQGLLTR